MPGPKWIRPQNLADVRSEILAGLPNERGRLDDAMFDLEFYEGDFSRFPPRPSGQSYDSKRFNRVVPLMQRIINVLTDYLYAQGPTRTIADHPEASEWLDAIYKANGVDSLFQSAEQLSAATRIAAFQVEGGPDPKRPVEITVWDGSQLAVWCHPDRPLEPIAVATIDLYDMQRRIRLWTDRNVETFVTDKWNPGDPNGSNAYSSQRTEPNPYGFIPFSFVHWKLPIRDFYTSAPGTMLRQINDGANFFLTEHSDCIRYNTRPVVVLKNVRPGWQPPKPIKPGDVWDLPGDDDSEESGKQDAAYLQSDVGFVAAGWDDFNSYIDLTMEMNGVPPAAVRLVQDAASSGIQIVVEQIPLILWAQKRQRPFSRYEHNLASLTLRVGAKHLGAQTFDGYRTTSTKLQAAADELVLTLRWPDMWPDIPGESRDKSDQWLLDNGLTSRTKVLMERDNLTREEAVAELEEVAEDLERERALFGDAEAAAPPKKKPPGKSDPDELDEPEEEEEPEPDEEEEAEPDEEEEPDDGNA